ncbi:MAG: hypothetical protein ACK4UJ_03635 [Leptonema sp. (in: bacteria)]
MKFLFRILYLGILNLILFLIYHHYREALILLASFGLVIFIKHFIITKKFDVQILLFDIGFLFSFLMLFVKENYFINFLILLVLFFFVVWIPYSLYSTYPIHLFFFITTILFFKQLKVNFPLENIFPIYILFGFPYSFFSFTNFIFSTLRMLLLVCLNLFIAIPDFINFISIMYGFYMYLFLFPFQIIKLKKSEFLLKILQIILESFTMGILLYFFYKALIEYLWILVFSILIFFEIVFLFIKKKLFNH